MSLALSFFLGFFLEASLGLVGFWTLEVSSLLFVYMLFNFFFSGHMFPLDIVPDPWRSWIGYLPLKYLAYFPAAVFLEKIPQDQLWREVGLEAVWTLLFIILFAFSRVPGIIPDKWVNFSAAYAFVFCAGVYLSGRAAWWLPLVVLLATDIGLNMYYWLCLGWEVWEWPALKFQLFNYVAYVAILWLGKRFKPRSSFVSLLGGGLLGALLFYLITNTASWFFNPFSNPEYTKSFTGWLIAPSAPRWVGSSASASTTSMPPFTRPKMV